MDAHQRSVTQPLEDCSAMRRGRTEQIVDERMETFGFDRQVFRPACTSLEHADEQPTEVAQ